ncbi:MULTISPECIES: tautomerase family protein [Pseudoalteromonas]|uniref:tautomerase family protein n=1 Tax=Pseudoalteromonas TaxID=53246 RepID=UPI000FFEC6DC|nr:MULTISPECIES: 4-oxalocrotonate tautomerase family protein [Pseudoalteromonas]MCG9760813.1 4-oxalocrotonate tautomerase family protein [Pseudoalteromonas sp. Isolate6]NKC17344.1 tautomerase [Pseudoalteromonas galatheae]RXE84607.1 tautomerase [Pseudoalteromonas sp. A757]
MPYVNIKITPTESGVTKQQKSDLIEGVAGVLRDVLGKPESYTTVVIDEVAIENWGSGGKQVTKLVS